VLPPLAPIALDARDLVPGFTGKLTVKQADPFHGKTDGETSPAEVRVDPGSFELGLLVGLLVGEGHFGGDGAQPHITLRMHTDHERLFQWIQTTFPGGKLYGPYNHGGRSYFQWMARGAFLRETIVPLLDRHLTAEIDAKSFARYQAMKERYRLGAAPEGDHENTK
jgi:hypothetical protein